MITYTIIRWLDKHPTWTLDNPGLYWYGAGVGLVMDSFLASIVGLAFRIYILGF